MILKMTISEIAENILRTERYVVVGYDKKTEKETRKELSFKYNDILLNVIDKGDSLLIFK
jgi:hypothetical protein